MQSNSEGLGSGWKPPGSSHWHGEQNPRPATAIPRKKMPPQPGGRACRAAGAPSPAAAQAPLSPPGLMFVPASSLQPRRATRGAKAASEVALLLLPGAHTRLLPASVRASHLALVFRVCDSLLRRNELLDHAFQTYVWKLELCYYFMASSLLRWEPSGSCQPLGARRRGSAPRLCPAPKGPLVRNHLLCHTRRCSQTAKGICVFENVSLNYFYLAKINSWCLISIGLTWCHKETRPFSLTVLISRGELQVYGCHMSLTAVLVFRSALFP